MDFLHCHLKLNASKINNKIRLSPNTSSMKEETMINTVITTLSQILFLQDFWPKNHQQSHQLPRERNHLTVLYTNEYHSCKIHSLHKTNSLSEKSISCLDLYSVTLPTVSKQQHKTNQSPVIVHETLYISGVLTKHKKPNQPIPKGQI